MKYYETVYIARQDLTDAQVQALTDKYSKVILDQGGKILKTESWGLRTFAYPINKARKGHYVLIESEANGPAMAELERLLGLDEDIVRSMTIRLKAPSTEPSPIINKSKKEAA